MPADNPFRGHTAVVAAIVGISRVVAEGEVAVAAVVGRSG